MSRIENIIADARGTLADPDAKRWSATRLIQLVDEAQKDICRQAKILRKRLYINLQPGIAEYSLPDDAIRLERILYKGKPVLIKTHTEMDKEVQDWEAKFSTEVKVVIYDKLNLKDIRVYPVPEVLDGDVPVSPLTGVVVSLAGFYMQDILGILTDLEISEDEIIHSEAPTENCLMIQYSRYPTKITKLTDTLEISGLYDKAIQHYVTGKALKDDMDAQNRAAGNEELGMYERELKEAKIDNSYDTTQKLVTTEYRGAF